MSEIIDTTINDYVIDHIPPENEFLRELEASALERNFPIITREVGQFLRFLINLKKPKNILEIGTAIGYSGILMLDSYENIENLITLEIKEDSAKEAEENFKKARVSHKTEILVDNALISLEKLQDRDMKFDFVFIDAAKGHYHEYFDLIEPMLSENAVVVCDNVLYKGMVADDSLIIRRKKTIVKRLREFIDYMMQNKNYESSLIPMGDGLLVIYKK